MRMTTTTTTVCSLKATDPTSNLHATVLYIRAGIDLRLLRLYTQCLFALFLFPLWNTIALLAVFCPDVVHHHA